MIGHRIKEAISLFYYQHKDMTKCGYQLKDFLEQLPSDTI